MKKKLLSLILALVLVTTLLPTTALAALPKGYWPVWSAYTAAVESGDDDAILQKGDAVINFYSKYDRNADIANQLFVIYRTRLDRLIYENRADWTDAIANTKALREICEYQISIGNDPEAYAEWLPRCDAHLAVVQPFTGIYAASYTQNRTYGSKIAPASGTLYGTPFEGCYEDSSIVSFYVEMENETAQTYSHYIDKKADGRRVILLNLNFKGEGTTARAVPSGKFDSNLKTTFSYLATLKSPVLVRIGAEANVWTDSVTPADFIAAYNYIGRLARSLAPKAELVWSPNCASAWGVNTADFYPANDLVDWVGLSLYYNYANAGGTETKWLEFVRAGKFADPITNAEDVIKIARAKNKPVIVTEGGAVDTSAVPNFKANKVSKEFAQLTMVYPEVKAMLHFDKAIGGNDYRLTGNAKTQVDQAIARTPSLISYGGTSGATYIPITQLNEKMSGTLDLGATGHTYANTDMSAAWLLDNKEVSVSNQYSIALSSLAAGAHKLEVRLSDKAKTAVNKVYTLDYRNGTVKVTEGYNAAAVPQPTGNTPFTDVPAGAYYEDAVLWALDNHVTDGMGDNKFGSNLTVTRGQAVTFLWRAVGQPEPSSTANLFTDVSEKDYFYKPVLWAVEKGITNGTGDAEFSPNATCTRGHIATFLYRTQGEPDKTGAGTWYDDAVNWAAGKNLLSGTAEAFAPGANCPRSDVVTYLYRALAR